MNKSIPILALTVPKTIERFDHSFECFCLKNANFGINCQHFDEIFDEIDDIFDEIDEIFIYIDKTVHQILKLYY